MEHKLLHGCYAAENQASSRSMSRPPHPLPPPASHLPQGPNPLAQTNIGGLISPGHHHTHIQSTSKRVENTQSSHAPGRGVRSSHSGLVQQGRRAPNLPPSLPPGRASRLPALMADFVCIDTAPQTCTAERGQHCPAGGSA